MRTNNTAIYGVHCYYSTNNLIIFHWITACLWNKATGGGQLLNKLIIIQVLQLTYRSPYFLKCHSRCLGFSTTAVFSSEFFSYFKVENNNIRKGFALIFFALMLIHYYGSYRMFFNRVHTEGRYITLSVRNLCLGSMRFICHTDLCCIARLLTTSRKPFPLYSFLCTSKLPT